MIQFNDDDMQANWQKGFNDMLQLLHAVGYIAQGKGDVIEQTAVSMGIEAVQYAAEITPFVTGSLATSHELINVGKGHAYVHINPNAVNPYSDENPPEYGPKVHKMGEDHAGTLLAESRSGGARAFYTMTVELFGEDILDVGSETFFAQLEVLR